MRGKKGLLGLNGIDGDTGVMGNKVSSMLEKISQIDMWLILHNFD